MPKFRQGMASLIHGNSRMMVLLYYVAASAQSGSTLLATIWPIAKRVVQSVTGTRKNLSVVTVRVAVAWVSSRMAV